jgi:hypothetical protein
MFVGVVLMVLKYDPVALHAWPWLDLPLLTELGSTLFASGLIVVAFQYINERDADERANERLRKVLKEEAPAIRDAVIDGFAFAPDALVNVASPQTLDRIARNTLAIQLGDQELANDLYADLHRQVTRSAERRSDMRVSVSLAPWDKGPATGDGSMFVATIRREYRVVPVLPTQNFTCVSDRDEYRELLLDPASTLVWYFEPKGRTRRRLPRNVRADAVHRGR